MTQEQLIEEYPYPIEILDEMTRLVQIIKFRLYKEKCSFGEACKVAKMTLELRINKELDLETLKSMLPIFLEDVRMNDGFCELKDEED